jgi:hypothetical protein
MEGRFSEAWAVYPWPSANLLLAHFASLSGLPLETAAHVLALLWHLLLAWAFLDLLRSLGADRATLVAGTVLLLSLAHLNEYRAFVGRDHGYWAWLITALALYFRHVGRRHWATALGAGMALCIAFLFRVEGAILIAFAPLMLLANRVPRPSRLAGALWMLAPALAGLLLVVLLYPDRGLATFGRMGEWSQYLTRTLGLWQSGFSAKGEALAKAVLVPWSAQFGLTGVVATLTAIYLIVLIEATGWLASALALHAAASRPVRTRLRHGGLLLGFIVVLLLIPAGLLSTQFFVTGRHLVPLALLAALPAAFALADLWQQRSRAMRGVLVVLLLVTLHDGAVTRASDKAYLKEAAYWARATYGAAAEIHADQRVLAWYAESPAAMTGPMQTLAAQVQARTLSYAPEAARPALLLTVDRQETGKAEWLQSVLGKPAQRFSNKKGDAVLVWPPG